MSRHQLWFFISLGSILFGSVRCETPTINCYLGKTNLGSCTIYDADFTEETEFQLTNSWHFHPPVIHKLLFFNSRVSRIPHGIFTKFPNLLWINFRHCRMLEVKRSDFMDADHLIILDMAYNSLTVLKDSIFDGANIVKEINLSHNKIMLVSDNTFQNLNYLNRINLSHNRIKRIASNVFTNLIALRYIDLSVNLIETITADDSYANMNLIVFDLSYNSIVAVDQRAFIKTKFIRYLNLNFNNVNNLNISDVTINIKELGIKNNNLTGLETNNKLRILEATNNQLNAMNLIIGRNVVTLMLLNNSITNFNFIKPLSKLIYLDVSFNQLDDTLEPDTFAQLTKLKKLFLESVNLKKIDFEIFSNLKQLTDLDVSYNDVGSVNFHMLTIFKNLRYLYIGGNRLSQLPLDDFDVLFPNLDEINISDNHWTCSYLSVILKRFIQLNIKLFFDDGCPMVKNRRNIRGIQCYDQYITTPPKLAGSSSLMYFIKLVLVLFFVIGIVCVFQLF